MGMMGQIPWAILQKNMITGRIPNLTRLGLANLHPLKGVTPAEHPLGYQLVLNEKKLW